MNELAIVTNSYVVQSRSEYQLRHFVIGQHDTPQMQFRQILIEAQDLEFKIRTAEVSQRRSLIECQKLDATGDEIDALNAEEKRIGMAYSVLALEGAKRELAILAAMFNESTQFTAEDIEANQPEYWLLRLQRQADTDQLSAAMQISGGNLASMMQVGMCTKNPVNEIDGS